MSILETHNFVMFCDINGTYSVPQILITNTGDCILVRVGCSGVPSHQSACFAKGRIFCWYGADLFNKDIVMHQHIYVTIRTLKIHNLCSVKEFVQ